MLEAGQPAPDFSLPDQDGNELALSGLHGKKYWGTQRATFIVGPDGKIAKVFPKVSPQIHDDVVLEALAELSAT